MSSLLELKGISKSFVGVAALSDVDFDVRAGEIHALMGENGAGKSTLIKALTGVYPPETGSILLNGTAVSPQSPEHAVGLGISTVYQEVNLLPNLTVMENLLIGRQPRGPLGIQWKELRRRAEAAVARLDLDIDVTQTLSSLPIALQQMVAIARALDVSAQVLILDEPTSSLDASEVDRLFTVLKNLREAGMAIVFVTHFLEQVYALADRVTVLRNGKKIGTWEIADLPRLRLVSEMIGRDAAELDRQPSIKNALTGKAFLEANNLGRKGSINGVTLSVGEGETIGLAGLLGAGRTETARLLFGIDGPDDGFLKIDKEQENRLTPRRAIAQGFGYLSEDRKHEGIFAELTVRENILILMQVKNGWFRRIPLQQQRTIANDLATRLSIRPSDMERQIQFLSGGNQQKALLARWLAVEPRFLILDEPTRGIDVGAKFDIMSLVDELRATGKSFLFISSELAEVVRSSTKVLVLRDRKVVGLVPGEEVTEERIVREIAGA